MARIARHPMALAAATATVVALGAGALVLPAAAADGAPAGIELKNGTLDWGIKQSFRSYVTGAAAGSIAATDGATQAAGNGPFTFTGGTGTYDTATHGTDTSFKGAVRFSSKAHGFDIRVSDVKVVTSGTTGHIDADVSLNGTVQNDIEFATLDLSGVRPGQGAGGAMTFKDIPATLTAKGAAAFNGMYKEGTALDAATLTVTAGSAPTASPTPTRTPQPTPTATATTTPAPSTTAPAPSTTAPTRPAAASGEIADGNLDWGVKESFRSYITGPVAKGKVELSGGAARNGSVYRFGDASGVYDADAKSLDAKFAGGVRFLGHEEGGAYSLDLRFSDLRVTARGTGGKLVADVSSKDRESGRVTTYDNLTVATLKVGAGALTAKDDVVELDGAAATLTAAGAKAFGGFYQAGAALDPVTAAVSLDADATLPVGSGGSDGGTSGGTSGGTGTTGSTTTGGTGTTGSTTGGSLAATGADVPAGPLAAAAALVVAAGAGTVFATRRRRTRQG
ncbi:HtaA domain-containing protein [Streptomyces sp. NPDC088785]|uniref:HtaA domain-containing protein n=1 Tax=Streptomyces sp. NPDC088785 TaxID=3365897 RepID=UPI003807EB9D